MVSSIYLFSREDHSRELQGLLAAAPGKQVLSRAQSFDSVGDLADLLVHPCTSASRAAWSETSSDRSHTVWSVTTSLSRRR